MTKTWDGNSSRRAASELVDCLRQAREDQGLTMQEVGAKAGVVKSQVHAWESGRVQPATWSLVAWAGALGFRVVLVEEEPEG